MKNRAIFINLTILLLLCPIMLLAQEVKIGDTFTIGSPEYTTYDHILFPRKNFIIKRGGIADMKMVTGLTVVVEGISYDAKGKTIVTLERADGLRFFRAFQKIDARLEDAIDAGELISG